MSIYTCLDLSTCHVRKETMDPVCRTHLLADYEYGAIYYVPSSELGLDPDTPQDLAVVLGYAMGKGCALVRLDADGETLDDLPTYDW